MTVTKFLSNKGLYNQYVGLMGGAKKSCAAVGRGNRIHIIQDDIPLIYYLSDSKVFVH